MKTGLNATMDQLLAQARSEPSTAVKVADARGVEVEAEENLHKLAEAVRNRPAPRLTLARLSTVKAARYGR